MSGQVSGQGSTDKMRAVVAKQRSNKNTNMYKSKMAHISKIKQSKKGAKILNDWLFHFWEEREKRE